MGKAPDKEYVEIEAAKVPFASNGMEAPTILVDDIRGAGVLGGVARMNLVENRVDPITSQVAHRVVAVLAVPLESVVNWGPFLTKHFSKEVLEQVMAARDKKPESDA